MRRARCGRGKCRNKAEYVMLNSKGNSCFSCQRCLTAFCKRLLKRKKMSLSSIYRVLRRELIYLDDDCLIKKDWQLFAFLHHINEELKREQVEFT